MFRRLLRLLSARDVESGQAGWASHTRPHRLADLQLEDRTVPSVSPLDPTFGLGGKVTTSI